MYIKPMCNCGEPLYIYNEEVIKVFHPVTKIGFRSKRVTSENDGSNNVYERLVCRKCGNEFWMEEDNKGRIVKGEEFFA